MLFPVMLDTKLCEGSMLSEQSTRIICTHHTPNNKESNNGGGWLEVHTTKDVFLYKATCIR